MEIQVRNHIDQSQLGKSEFNQNEDFKKTPIDVSPELAGAIAGTMMAKPQTTNVVAIREPNIGAVMPNNEIKSTLQNLNNDPVQVGSRPELKNFNTDVKSALVIILAQAFQTIENSARQNQAEWVKVKGQMNEGTANAMRTAGMEALKGAAFQAMAGVGISAGGWKMQQNGLNRERGILKNDHLDLANKNNALNIAQNNSAKVGSPSLSNTQPAPVTQLRTQDGRTINLQPNRQTIDQRHQAHLDDAAQTKLKHEIKITENSIKDKQSKADSQKASGMLVSSLSHPTTGVVNGNTQYVQAEANADQLLHQQASETSQNIVDGHKESAANTAKIRDAVIDVLAQLQKTGLETNQFLVSKYI